MYYIIQISKSQYISKPFNFQWNLLSHKNLLTSSLDFLPDIGLGNVVIWGRSSNPLQKPPELPQPSGAKFASYGPCVGTPSIICVFTWCAGICPAESSATLRLLCYLGVSAAPWDGSRTTLLLSHWWGLKTWQLSSYFMQWNNRWVRWCKLQWNPVLRFSTILITKEWQKPGMCCSMRYQSLGCFQADLCTQNCFEGTKFPL